MGDLILGIDLGTTNSVVAVADGGQARVLTDADGHRLIPSVVSFPEDGRVLVGEEAREKRLIDASNTIYAVKRLIGRPYESPEVQQAAERFAFDLIEGPKQDVQVRVRNETYALAEISAYVLRECRRVAEQVLGHPCEQAVITVPANFNELQRSATKAAGQVAGLDVLRILNEPTAAAVAYGYGDGSKGRRVVVYDLGGGTFDVTVLELEGDVFEVLSTCGDTFLGGDDVDLALAEELAGVFENKHGWDPRKDAQAFERLRAAAEWAKCTLSTEEEVRLELEAVKQAQGRGAPVDFQSFVSRRRLESLADPLIARSLEVCDEALRLANLTVDEVDGVLMVGGSTRIPAVRSRVGEFFGKQPQHDVDPDLAVALGAAMQGFALSGTNRAPSLSKLPSPSPALVAATRERKAKARAERPAQPAFAPNAIPDLPMPSARGAAKKGYKPAPPSSGGRPAATKKQPKVPSLDRLSLPPPSPADARAMEMPTAEFAIPVKSPDAASHVVTAEIPLDDLAGSEDARPSVPPVISTEAFSFEAPTSPALDASALQSSDRDANALIPIDDEDSGAFEMDLDLDELDSQELEAVPSTRSAAHAPPPAPLPPPAPARAPAAPATNPWAAEQIADMDLDFAGRTSFDAIADELVGGDDGALDDGPVEIEAFASIPPSEAPPAIPEPPAVPMTGVKVPVLMDVTPLSLGIATAGGYCEFLVRRNTPIPVEQTRVFSTAIDGQEAVEVAVCQGESRSFEENQELGSVTLEGIRAAARGTVKIQVTFMLDANGTLDVKAVDPQTGASQTTRISLLGGLEQDEIDAMRARQEARAAG